jgi:hypothetical protein
MSAKYWLLLSEATGEPYGARLAASEPTSTGFPNGYAKWVEVARVAQAIQVTSGLDGSSGSTPASQKGVGEVPVRDRVISQGSDSSPTPLGAASPSTSSKERKRSFADRYMDHAGYDPGAIAHQLGVKPPAPTQTAYDPPVESPRCHLHGLSYEPNCDFCQDASAARGTIRKWRNQAWAAEYALKAPADRQQELFEEMDDELHEAHSEISGTASRMLGLIQRVNEFKASRSRPVSDKGDKP